MSEFGELEPLIGTWKGKGHGAYPTIESFDYLEEVTYSTIPGKPFLVYGQKTRHAQTGEPLHTEAGYVRSVGPGLVELTISQPTGIIEALSGTVSDGIFGFVSDAVVTTPTAVEVLTTERVLTVLGDQLSYVFWMGAVGEPHQVHLTATLQRS